MDKLLHCPFCGESKYIGVKTTINNCHYFSLCGSCGASSGYENTVEQAISAWNKRVKE
jgi:Lar family restriction alleviation protein